MKFLANLFKYWLLGETYRKGRRDAFKEAARWARLRSDLILEAAPHGRLRDGLLLASLASSLADDYDNKSKGE